jgi:peptide/nickel transport system ATP-binding protein
VVRYIADRIAVMAGGRIVEVGGAEALFENPRSDETRHLLAAIPKIRYAPATL